MCGIGYAVQFNGSPVNDSVLARYKNQRMRGIEGFGIYDRSQDNIIKTPKEDEFLGWIKKYKSNDLLFHHRTPTSAPNVKNACHPFSTGNYFDKTYIMVHNGWVNNCNTLVNEHDALGINYSSLQDNNEFNDSESLVWDFALWREGLINEMKSIGFLTFICIVKDDHGDKLYFYRNSNPLKSIINLDGIMLSSEGKGEEVPRDTLFCYDYNTGLLTFEHLELDTFHTNYNTAYSGGRWNARDDLDDDSKSPSQRYLALSEDKEEEDLDAEYSYPLLQRTVEKLWPKDGEKQNAFNLRYLKPVTKYLNNKLRDKDGVYEDVYESMEKDTKVFEQVLNKTATKGKAKLKYQYKLTTATIAIDVLFSIPLWQTDTQPIDPFFIEELLNEGQAA